MPDPTHCEMAQMHYQPLCPKDDLIATLIAAASSHRYTPAAPSPLNPRSSSSSGGGGGDGAPKPRRHAAARPRRARPTRKKPVETPTERLLRRKAAIAYERTTTHNSPPHGGDGGVGPTLVAAHLCDLSEKRPPAAVATREVPSKWPKRAAGPIVVNMWQVRHDLLNDVERQSAMHLAGIRQQPAPRQRLEILLMLVLLSACLTLLTVLGLDSLKSHYVGG